MIIVNSGSGNDKAPIRFLKALQKKRGQGVTPFVILLASDLGKGMVETAIRNGKLTVDAVLLKKNTSQLDPLIRKIREGVSSHHNQGAYI